MSMCRNLITYMPFSHAIATIVKYLCLFCCTLLSILFYRIFPSFDFNYIGVFFYICCSPFLSFAFVYDFIFLFSVVLCVDFVRSYCICGYRLVEITVSLRLNFFCVLFRLLWPVVNEIESKSRFRQICRQKELCESSCEV